MTFSDGLPVQFWLTDCETFNEKEVPGINPACWCQPFQCDDEINIQFQADETSPVTEYSLLVRSETGYLAELPFTDNGSGVQSVSLVPNDESICDEVISFEIAEADSVQTMDAPSDWTEIAGAWTSKTATEFTLVDAVYPPGPATSYMTVSAEEGDTIIFEFTTLQVGTVQNLNFYFSLADDLNNTQSNIVQEVIPIGTTTFSIELIATGAATRLILTVGSIGTPSGGTCDVTLTMPAGEVIGVADVLAKSDCINIRTAHSGTELIEYSNNRNFAGLIYEDVSPPSTFYLRVPAVFFHPRFPQESRAIERTSSTIVTSSKLKKQRLMQVLHAPAYFHGKLIIALSHHNVSIQNKQWKMEEGYEMDEGDPRYPLKKGTVYLTEKNFLARNVL